VTAGTRLRSAVNRIGLRAARWRGDPLASILSGTAIGDPYPLYARLRRQPLSKSMLGAYATASHATAATVLRDGRFSSSPSHQPGYRQPAHGPGDPRSSLLGPETSLLTMDPPDHARIRRLVAPAFTRKAVDALEPFVRETAATLLGAADADVDSGFDLVDRFALPLPIAVICHLLGVPGRDQARFRAWGHDVAATLEPRMTAEPDRALVDSELALTAYLRELISARRRHADGTLLSTLIAAEEDGERLSEPELVSTALLLLVAGFETTVNLIANGTAALLGAPDVWAQLREEPNRWPDAVEELLRYDSPVQLTSRTATEDLELAGATLRRGSAVIVAIGGANRDPHEFCDADRIVLDRRDKSSHLSFSLGAHHCLGAALARLEARVAFEELTARLERPTLAGRPVRRSLLVLRGYESLPVRSLARGERSEAPAGRRVSTAGASTAR
jgi:cytochrome P450